MNKRILTLLIVLATLIAGTMMVSADTNTNINITLTEDIQISGDAYSLTATPLSVTNNGNKVSVEKISLANISNGWTIVPKNTDFTTMAANQKKMSVCLDGSDLSEDLTNLGTIDKNNTKEFTTTASTGATAVDINNKVGDLIVTVSPLTATLTYHANGGTGNDISQDILIGETVTADACTFTSEDKIFKEWNTSSDGTGTSYNPGDEITLTSSVNLYAIWKDKPCSSAGGRIFYVDSGDNGATYTFYDEDDNILTEQTVEGLKTAVRYEIEGTPTKDKFYVVATNSADGHPILGRNIQWGAYETDVGITTDGIGQGKPNTEVALANSECFKDSTSGTQETGSNTIWTWLKDKIDNNQNGCNDWFIPSVAELKKLYDSGIEKDYIINTLGYDYQYLWSSVEDDSRGAYGVRWSSGGSNGGYKYYDLYDSNAVWGCVAVRTLESASITYHSNDGTDNNYSINSTINSNVTADACTFTAPEGKFLLNWNTKPDGSGIAYDEGEDILINGEIDLYAMWKERPGFIAGGRIFYVDPDDNGATYTFYDKNDNVLTEQTVEGLSTAVRYEMSGTPTKDKFYILATNSSDGRAIIKSDVEWGAYGKSVGIIHDGIGKGKPNTATALANSNCFISGNNSHTDPRGTVGGSNTIWTWLKAQRDNNLNGYNDWFIPSVAELQALLDSNIEKAYIKSIGGYDVQEIWSSVEDLNERTRFAKDVPWTKISSFDTAPLYSNKYRDHAENKSNTGYDYIWCCVATRSF